MRTITIAGMGTLFVVSSALAGEAPEFTKVDQDKNGYVSRDEARAEPQIMAVFASADANRDNQLSTAEYMEAVKQLQG